MCASQTDCVSNEYVSPCDTNTHSAPLKAQAGDNVPADTVSIVPADIVSINKSAAETWVLDAFRALS